MVSNTDKIIFVKSVLSQHMLEDGVPQEYVHKFKNIMDEYLKHGILRVNDYRLKNLVEEIAKILNEDNGNHLILEPRETEILYKEDKITNAMNAQLVGRRRRHYRYPYRGWYNWWYGYRNGWYRHLRPYYLNYGWNKVG